MSKRGFTLIEILMVIFIFGILVSITGYVYAISAARSRDSQRLGDLGTIKNGLEQFYADNKAYPNFTNNANNGSLNSKVQLESMSGGTTDCSSAKRYLAPYYIQTIPQDPQYKFDLSANNCNQSLKGFYLYMPYNPDLTGNLDTSPRQYYLAARMERTNNMSTSIPTEVQDSRVIRANNLVQFCTAVTNNTSCYQNYYVKNSNND